MPASEPDDERTDGGERCGCCRSSDAGTVTVDTPEQFEPTDGAVLETRLPAPVQTTLGRFLGRSSIDTLEEWATAVRQFTGGSIAVEHLCRTDEETPHWASVDGDRRHFLCFYDAVILAALVDQPVDIHTESPAGAAIQVHAVGTDELRVRPEDAVFSFGIADHAGSIPDGEPTLADAYDAICPYVKAFPDRAAYEAWAASVPAATVAMPLSGATDLAAALAR